MSLLGRFLDPSRVSLKVCGVTRPDDGAALADLSVDAVGVNFWPGSKRYHPPEDAGWLAGLAGRILRVGVFVNQPADLPLRLVGEGLIDVVQLHGDETPEDAAPFRDAGIPFIKAVGVRGADDLEEALGFGAAAVLLDAHAPGVYGGTGMIIDWDTARTFAEAHPGLPVILAGGITAENAAAAAATARPAALDTASGVEVAPGVKDLDKVAALLHAIGR